MRYILIIILYFTISVAGAQSLESNHAVFFNAYTEIVEMLDNKRPLSLKRAIFLIENAYLDNSLDYQAYSKQIDDITKKLYQFIEDKNIGHNRMAGNFAIYSYMKEPSKYNNNVACNYNFDDFLGIKEYKNTFVTTLLVKKLGNCTSLPLLYKILANEINAEASIAFAPSHMYVMHRDDKGSWVNVELTSGNFPSDNWVIKVLNIPISGIKSGVYMNPQTEKETILYCLNLLARYYYRKYKNNIPFVIRVVDKVEEYYPVCHYSIVTKSIVYGDVYRNLRNKESNPKSNELILKLKALYSKLDSLGYSQASKEQYEAIIKNNKAQKTTTDN